jgi:glycosyltransferase involved in cell wall biosynthesis
MEGTMTQRLMIATGIFHPEAGGPATYLHEILPALQARGWQPDVLTYGDAPVSGYPYPVERIPRRALPLRLLHYWWQAGARAAAADLIYAHTIDLPVRWGNTPRIIKIVGDQAWERCIRRGWVPANTGVDEFQHGAFGALVQRQRLSRERQVQAFDGVIVPGEYLKAMVSGWNVPAERIHVIYNALPALPDHLPQGQAQARQMLGWDEQPVVLTAARLEAWKGVDHLIRALDAVPDVRLIVAGDGPELARLQALAAESGRRVTFTGRLPREQLYLAMQAADYFALYSGYEGLSHTLLEALRMGTPVLASDKGGNPEVVTAGINGLLVPHVNLEALREALREAFSGTRRAELAAGSAHGMERFGFERMVSETDRILRRYMR